MRASSGRCSVQSRTCRPHKPERIIVKSAGQVLFVKHAEIDWVEAADYYSCLHVGTRTHLVRRSMAELESQLDPSTFCRVHRSAIVNLHRVAGLQTGQEGESEVLLQTGERLRLSRRYRALLKERLGLRSLPAI
jgi:two-component system LytT family response regulator